MNDRFDLQIITQHHSEVYCGYFRRLVFGNSNLTISHVCLTPCKGAFVYGRHPADWAHEYSCGCLGLGCVTRDQTVPGRLLSGLMWVLHIPLAPNWFIKGVVVCWIIQYKSRLLGAPPCAPLIGPAIALGLKYDTVPTTICILT